MSRGKVLPSTSVELDEHGNIKAPKELTQAQALGNLLDTAVRLPIINIKVGLDFLVGLIPVVGDTIMLFASLRIVHLAHKLGIPKPLKTKMLINTFIDWLLGFVPVLGDIVDIFFKANQRNVRILELWWVSENKAEIDKLRAKMLKEWEDKQN
ncbi:DUF4112 domain-containing protein [Ningiella sp. W23]|uniref:DUF4112 domain-containing protein n=1 Tax=Ningiella sp. W23 TaxID=3023715 RepID=UPI0037579760